MDALRIAVALSGCLLPIAATAAAPSTVCIGGDRFTPSFSDDLTHFRASGGNWDTGYPWGRTNPGAHDDAYYVDPSSGADPFTITPDGLRITAAVAPPALRSAIAGHTYTSGLITTRHSFSQTYGYFEAQLQIPRGKGLWPAFWLLPVSGYPPELDVIEALGDAPQRIYSSTHPVTGSGAQVHTDVNDPGGFHRYGMAWTPDGITFYVDGARTGTVPNVSQQPMYMLLNLQVGGPQSWPGPPESAGEFPASMTVRYVHAYRLAGKC